MKPLLLLALIVTTTHGIDLKDLKGPLENKELHIPEATHVPYPIFQFTSGEAGIDSYRVHGDLGGISISEDGWLYLTEPLSWSTHDSNTHILQVEALAGDEVVDGPHKIVVKVIDVNNNAPHFEKDQYSGEVMEHSLAGMPFLQVQASDMDDANSVNAALRYSIVRMIPDTDGVALFQIDAETGEISTTQEGSERLRARDGLRYSRGEERCSRELLERQFSDYCAPVNNVPVEENPFFTRLLRACKEPSSDPDYTLIVKVEDMAGAANALSSTIRVNIAVRKNLWVNPGPFQIRENMKAEYPLLLATVTSNDPSALYSLSQKERLGELPFTINEHGEIHVTRDLDREDKHMYVLVVFARDEQGVEVDRPMEIMVTVVDENDNTPECGATEFEVQENEVLGSVVGNLNAFDADDENTRNALLTYTLKGPGAEGMFKVDSNTGEITVAKTGFRRSIFPQYTFMVSVSDGGVPALSTECKVTIKVIDINNELPIFEKKDYGRVSAAEDAGLGSSLLRVKATDADDPNTGSSKVLYHIAAGDDDGVFSFQLDEATGEGILTLAKPLDFEDRAVYELQIHARNPEPLVKGLEYGEESTAVVVVDVTNVDEAPVFDVDLLTVSVPENLTVGTTVLSIQAHDPEGKEIMFKLEGDERGWLAIDSKTGELKTKKGLDYEEVQHFTVKVVAYEKDAPGMKVEKEVDISLTDVNDNVPKLLTSEAFLCVKDHKKPLVVKAQDADAAPFGAPLTFNLATKNQRSPNWELKQQDDTSALLTLKKLPTSDETFPVPISIKDSAGMGVTHKFNVRVCNCTEFGFCYVEPKALPGIMGMEATIGILAGVMGFIVILLVIAIKRSKKKKSPIDEDEGETMM